MNLFQRFFKRKEENQKESETTFKGMPLSKLYYYATRDEKTSLYNYRYFRSLLQHELNISERYNRPISLMIIDLDNFKRINDNYGYLRGDEVLHFVATLINESIRESDIAGRFGGEEFVVLMPETKEEEAEKLAERIRQLIMADKFLLKYNITVSIGVAQNLPIEENNSQTQHSLYAKFMPKTKEPPKEKIPNDKILFEKANEALRYAKDHGKNRVVAYSKIKQLKKMDNFLNKYEQKNENKK